MARETEERLNLLLEPYRVLDLADEKGAQCVKTLAELGADVVKVEPPEGDMMRHCPPFANDIPHPEGSLSFAYYNTNKRSITLNLNCEEGRNIFKRLMVRFDVVVESFAPGVLAELSLDYAALSREHPGIIVTSITGFGQTGPHAHYKDPDIICFALGGPMYPSGERDREPCTAPGNLAYGVAGAWAAAGTIIALYSRAATGVGQHIDVSIQEAAAMITDSAITRFSYEGAVIPREGNTYPWITPGDLYPCKDGWARIVAGQTVHWRRLIEWMGNPEPLKDPVWENREKRNKEKAFVDGMLAEFTRTFTRAELFAEGQRRGVPVTPVNTPAEYMHSETSRARSFFKDVVHPVVGQHPYAEPPYRFTETPVRPKRPAPLLGQDNEALYCGELGITREDLCGMRARKVI